MNGARRTRWPGVVQVRQKSMQIFDSRTGQVGVRVQLPLPGESVSDRVGAPPSAVAAAPVGSSGREPVPVATHPAHRRHRMATDGSAGRGRNECGSVVLSWGDPRLGAGRGVRFKNSTAIETSNLVDVMMDKTGTLNLGAPDVTDWVVDGMPDFDALALVAAVEGETEHPVAQAVVRHAETADAARWNVEGFSSVPGMRAVATVNDCHVAVGITRLMDRESVELCTRGTIHRNRAADRDTAGCQHDDRRGVAGDKAAKVKELMGAGRRVATALVGDGVNDVLALPRGDLGIDIGAGTDVAVETADAVLLSSDPLDVAVALRTGRGAVRIERQSPGWPIGYTTIALMFAAGVFEPALGLVFRRGNAAITIAGSSALVAVDALTVTWLKLPRSAPADPAGAPSRESSGASAGVSAVTGRR